MPHSEPRHSLADALKTLAIALICASGLIWLNQKPLNQYWALHFHHESPWASATSPLWREGARVMAAAKSARVAFLRQLSASTDEVPPKKAVPQQPTELKTTRVEETHHPVLPAKPTNARQLSRWVTANAYNAKSRKASLSMERANLYDPQGKAILEKDKKVLLIGDSMMEGVGPRVVKILKEEHGAVGIDLSKRSTGLSYPGFFNWPAATKKALEQHTDVGLLVVFLGPNDPWDMPAGRGKPYLKYHSEDWELEYRKRIRQILNLATQQHIPVIWILPPNMRKKKLSDAMTWLGTLYSSEVENIGGEVLSVNDIFGYQQGKYSPNIVVNGKFVHIRAGDGIHYSPAGLQIISRYIINYINFSSPRMSP